MTKLIVTQWPGISRVSDSDIWALYRAIPETWNLNDLLGHISSESGFNPQAKSPGSSARGLIQMIDETARRYGRGGSTFKSQIPGIVKYFADASKGQPMSGADFKLAGFNHGAYGKPLSYVLYQAGSPGANANKHVLDSIGNMTVGSVTNFWNAWSSKYQGTREVSYAEPAALASDPTNHPSGVLIAVPLFALAFLVVKRFKVTVPNLRGLKWR